MRRALLVLFVLLAACPGSPPRGFDGGACTFQKDDGGSTCEIPGDSCRPVSFDDPCTTTCACGADAGWTCTRTCPPSEPCRLQAYCEARLTEAACETDDGGCTRVCACGAYNHVDQCATRCP